jgi:RNA polymerase sigma factor (sigma-70 family)
MLSPEDLERFATAFYSYRPLCEKQIESTVYRMRLPVPKGVEAPRGLRWCIRSNRLFRGAIVTAVFTEFARALAAREVDPLAAEGWIVTVTRRITRDEAEKLARRLARQVPLYKKDGSAVEGLLLAEETPEELVLWAEEHALRHERLEALLANFRPADRALLHARVVDEVPYEELAPEFGCTSAALRKRFERLMDRLRKRTEEVVGVEA